MSSTRLFSDVLTIDFDESDRQDPHKREDPAGGSSEQHMVVVVVVVAIHFERACEAGHAGAPAISDLPHGISLG